MAGGGGGSEGDYGLQIAPMLDVMFVLMLFFMVMAGMQVREAELGIDLPSRSGLPQNEKNPPTPVQIKIDDRDQVYFNDDAVDTPDTPDLVQLTERLKKVIDRYGEKNPVIILPNDLATHKRIIHVMDACRAAKVLNMSFGSS